MNETTGRQSARTAARNDQLTGPPAGHLPYRHGPGSFAPRDMGAFGVCETKEDYTRVENMIKKRFPGHSVRVEADSASDKRNRANDARHRLWEQRKKVGLDARQVSEMGIEKARTKGVKNAKVLNNKPAPAMK